MKWVTRKNASVDRIACPWLIKRFIDPEAEFLYVAAPDVPAVAEREGAVPYDVAGVELGHVDGRCSFESIIVKYDLKDPALDRLALIVHGADVAADIDVTPEAAGLKAIAHGFAIVHGEADTARSSWRARFTTRFTHGASTRPRAPRSPADQLFKLRAVTSLHPRDNHRRRRQQMASG